MSNPKFTPGKWSVCHAHDGRCTCHMVWSEELDCPVAVAISAKDEDYTGGYGITDETMIAANACLIAAAPTMLQYIELKASQGDEGAKAIIDELRHRGAL